MTLDDGCPERDLGIHQILFGSDGVDHGSAVGVACEAGHDGQMAGLRELALDGALNA